MTLEGPFAKTLCLYCSTGEGPEAPQLQRLYACLAPPRRAQKLRKAPGSCPEALGSSRKPHLHKLCACMAPPGRAQKLPHWKDFVLLLLHREVPKVCTNAQCSQCSQKLALVLGGKNDSAHNAYTK